MRRVILSLLALALASAASGATQGGAMPVPLPLFPSNNWWNTNITNAPVDQGSAAFITFIGVTRSLHPDFGGNDPVNPGYIYGIPFIVVDGAQPKLAVTFEVPGESDGVGVPFYPIPSEAITQMGWVEAGPPGNVDARSDPTPPPCPCDRHILIVDSTNNHLYELYNVWHNGAAWQAYSGAFFDMNVNHRRPDTWTSADAGGLALLPGLVRYDEVYGSSDEINHALRVTLRASKSPYVFPASHVAGANTSALPFGARLRLKAGKDISGLTPEMQKIFRAMKKYGLIFADNGSDMYISGTYDTRWSNDILNPAFSLLKASDFEVVQLGWQPATSLLMSVSPSVGAGDLTSVTITAYQPFPAGGDPLIATAYRGTIHFTSTDGAATLPSDYAFTAGDNGAHTFMITLRTPGAQSITIVDNAAATITTQRTVTVGPATPADLVATASTATQVGLTWSASAGATQYDVARGTTLGNIANIGTSPTPNYTDSTASAGVTYIYRVRAVDSSARTSAYSAPDVATTIIFTDDPIASGITAVKIVHLTQLRTAINAMRTAAALGTATFTDATLTGVKVKAVHVSEARTALNQARTALGLTTIAFIDPTITPQSTKVKAAHVQELRTGVK